MLHPVSLFPNLLSYPFLAYLIIRIVITWGILRIGAMRWKKSYKNLAIPELAVSLALLVGVYTQGALLVGIILMFADGYLDKKAGILDPREKIIIGILCVVSLALVLLGPGAFALDYPL